ncbi:hypothetical protein TPENAI_60794 [Tenacibaculum litopenaei]|uniref:hypothetical protein n=1 Tax=Tenacibaculum litopenaei TaxID=396016 RepID=UPI0038965B5D
MTLLDSRSFFYGGFILLFFFISCSRGTSVIIRNYNNYAITINISLNFKNEKITKKLVSLITDRIIENEDFDVEKLFFLQEYSHKNKNISIKIPPKSTIFLNSKRILTSIKFRYDDKVFEEIVKGSFCMEGSKTYYYNLMPSVPDAARMSDKE